MAFFGARRLPMSPIDSNRFIAYLAVPVRGTVVSQCKRIEFASRDSFDMKAVALIDNWVTETSQFVGAERTARASFRVPARG